jgi:8-oxo-dGTP diphosphatase
MLACRYSTAGKKKAPTASALARYCTGGAVRAGRLRAQAAESEGEVPGEEELIWPRGAASAAIFRGPEVLLIERGKAGPLRGLWSLPGGRIEPGERVRAAALREVQEETGVIAELAGLVDVHEVFRHSESGKLMSHYLLAVFYGRWVSGEPVAGDDAAAARFVPVDAIDQLQMTDRTPDFVRKALALLQMEAR